MNTTTTTAAETLEVGSRFGYDGEFVVTSIGPEEDGIFHVRFDHAGTPKSRFMSVGEPIITPAAKEAAERPVTNAQLVTEFESAVARSASMIGPNWDGDAWTATKSQISKLRTELLDRLADTMPPF